MFLRIAHLLIASTLKSWILFPFNNLCIGIGFDKYKEKIPTKSVVDMHVVYFSFIYSARRSIYNWNRKTVAKREFVTTVTEHLIYMRRGIIRFNKVPNMDLYAKSKNPNEKKG